MIKYIDNKYYRLVEISQDEIIEILQDTYNWDMVRVPDTTDKPQWCDTNLKVDSTDWEYKGYEQELWEKWELLEDWIIKEVKENPEWDIWELDNGEQLFTWEAAKREASKQGLRLPTDEELWEYLDNRDNSDIPLSGFRDTNAIFRNRGYYTFLWSSTPNGSLVRGRLLNRNCETVYRSSRSSGNGFSVRCIKD